MPEFNCVKLSRSALRHITSCDAVKSVNQAYGPLAFPPYRTLTERHQFVSDHVAAVYKL